MQTTARILFMDNSSRQFKVTGITQESRLIIMVYSFDIVVVAGAVWRQEMCVWDVYFMGDGGFHVTG